MALTPPGDLYVGLNDSIFPKALAALKAQRPSLFNYATASFASNPGNWCAPIPTPRNGAPLVTVIDQLVVAPKPVPPVELMLQITDIGIGFGIDTVGLPASMQPLPAQRIAAKLSFAARMSIPKLDPSTIGCPGTEQFANSSFPLHLCPCFTGDLYLTAEGNFKTCGTTTWIMFTLDNFDTTNLTPAALRETVNYFLVLTVDTTIVPNLWPKLQPYVIDLTKALPASAPIKTITINLGAPTATPNPNIANHLIEARFTAKVTTP